MSLQVTCSNCQAVLTLGDALAGKTISCTSCGAGLQVPNPAPPQPAPPPPAPTAQAPVARMAAAPAAVQAAAGAASGAGRWMLIVSLASSLLIVVLGGVAYYFVNGRLTALQDEIKDIRTTVGEESKEDREKATAARAKIDGDLQKVQNELNTEKGKQQQNRVDLAKMERNASHLRGEVDDLEQKIRDENQRQETDYKDRIAKLKDELDDKKQEWKDTNKELSDMKLLVATADLKIKSLVKDVTKLERRKFDDQPLWTKVKDLQGQLTALTPPSTPNSTAENVVTIVGEDKTANFWGRAHVFTLDTQTGTVRYSRRVGTNWTRSIPENPANPPQVDVEPGRYDIKVTYNAAGWVYDVVRLDTKTGQVWNWPVSNAWNTPPNPLPVWNYVSNWGRSTGPVNLWRLDVDASTSLGKGLALPGVTVTNTENKAAYGDYVNIAAHRNWMVNVH